MQKKMGAEGAKAPKGPKGGAEGAKERQRPFLASVFLVLGMISDHSFGAIIAQAPKECNITEIVIGKLIKVRKLVIMAMEYGALYA